jgi:uncharacterized protein
MSSCNESQTGNPVKFPAIYQGDYNALMKAASYENLDEMSRIVQDENLKLDFADKKYGVSLLNWCIINGKIKSFQKLLMLGANPNWQDSVYKYPPPIIVGAKESTTSEYLKLTLVHKGNVNLITTDIIGSENRTPLMGAVISGRLESVKLLIENGANPNLTADSCYPPLTASLIQDQIEITKFLLSIGADFTDMKYKIYGGEKQSILNLLRANDFALNSNEHKIKMEVVDFLKTKGLDYWKCPIPENIKSAYQNDKEFLSKY